MPRDARLGNRREDHSLWARFLANYRDISPLVGALIVILAAMGFGWKTPMQWFRQIEARQVATSKRVETIADTLRASKAARDTINFKLDFLVRAECQRLKPLERERQSACDGRITSAGTVVR